MCDSKEDIHTLYAAHFPTIIMEARKRKLSRSPSPDPPRPPTPPPTPSRTQRLLKDFQLPPHLMLYIAEYLSFVDFRNLVHALWPKNDADKKVKTKIWEMSIRTFTTTFINGQFLDIEYSFDSSRPRENRVLINALTLLPIFGGVVPPEAHQFKSVWSLRDFILTHVKLNRCSDGKFASCSCEMQPGGSQAVRASSSRSRDYCAYNHFHHFCANHVIHWLCYFLNISLAQRDENGFFDPSTTAGYLNFLCRSIHFRDTN